MDKSKPLVIVISRNYSTGLGVIRSLGAAGYTVDLIASTKKKGSSIIASSSKYVRNSVEVITTKIQGDDGSELIDEIMKYAKSYKGEMVLFPVDDFTTSVVDRNREILQPFFKMPEIMGKTMYSINQLMDKTIQGKLAEKSGLLTPKEVLVSLREELIIPKEVSYPCFVKPLQSISGQKTEMAVCENDTELKKHLCKMQNYYKDRDVLLQEYLSIDKEYDLSGVCIDQHVVIPAIIEKTRIAKHELGVTMCGTLRPVDVLGEVKGQIIDFLKSIHYVGMFDMELNVCGDKIYFNEINFRSGGPNYSYYLNGVNLPDIFVKEITGKGHNIKEEIMHEFGKTFVYEKVAWEDYMNSYMTWTELKQCIQSADFTLLEDASDCLPGKHFNKRIRMSALKHKIKKIMYKKKNLSENSGKSEERIVVIGRNYGNVLTMSRAFGEAGYKVDVLRIFKKRPHKLNVLSKMEPDAYCKYVENFHKCIVNDEPLKVLSKLIEIADEREKILLVPVDDYSACLVDEGYHKLSKYYHLPGVADKEGEIVRLMDKKAQKKVAEQYDLPMLKGVLITSRDGKFKIPNETPYPCFIKPNVSMNSTKSKMMKCNNKEELEKVLSSYAQKEDFEMLVEEFANIKAEYSVLGVSTQSKAIGPCVFRVIESGHKERKGVTIIGEAVDAEPFEKIINQCCEFIHGIGYKGLFDVDLIETTKGEIYFIELNFRAGASMHLFTKTGVNLPGIYADYLMKDKHIISINAKKSVGKVFVSEKLILEEYVRNDISLMKIIRLMKQADVYFIKDKTDYKPYRYFSKFFVVAMLMKIPYFIKDKKKL